MARTHTMVNAFGDYWLVCDELFSTDFKWIFVVEQICHITSALNNTFTKDNARIYKSIALWISIVRDWTIPPVLCAQQQKIPNERAFELLEMFFRKREKSHIDLLCWTLNGPALNFCLMCTIIDKNIDRFSWIDLCAENITIISTNS